MIFKKKLDVLFTRKIYYSIIKSGNYSYIILLIIFIECKFDDLFGSHFSNFKFSTFWETLRILMFLRKMFSKYDQEIFKYSWKTGIFYFLELFKATFCHLFTFNQQTILINFDVLISVRKMFNKYWSDFHIFCKIFRKHHVLKKLEILKIEKIKSLPKSVWHIHLSETAEFELNSRSRSWIRHFRCHSTP